MSAAKPHIDKLTIRYDRREDRLKLLMSDTAGAAQSAWLTQRLTRMLVPELFAAIERAEGESSDRAEPQPVRAEPGTGSSDRARAAEGFWRQTTAELERKLGPPVDAALVSGDTHLLTGVRMSRNGGRFTIELQWDEGSVTLPATSRYLRQLLRVIHNNCEKAGWPTTGIWPDWFALDAHQKFVDPKSIN